MIDSDDSEWGKFIPKQTQCRTQWFLLCFSFQTYLASRILCVTWSFTTHTCFIHIFIYTNTLLDHPLQNGSFLKVVSPEPLPLPSGWAPQLEGLAGTAKLGPRWKRKGGAGGAERATWVFVLKGEVHHRGLPNIIVFTMVHEVSMFCGPAKPQQICKQHANTTMSSKPQQLFHPKDSRGNSEVRQALPSNAPPSSGQWTSPHRGAFHTHRNQTPFFLDSYILLNKKLMMYTIWINLATLDHLKNLGKTSTLMHWIWNNPRTTIMFNSNQLSQQRTTRSLTGTDQW